MTLVDTSVWIEFFRRGEQKLAALLQEGQVAMHPFVLGELACGNLEPRTQIIADLQNLPAATMASNEEVMIFIEQHQLMGSGIGYLDAHLLASARLSRDTRLWTLDRRLAKVAVSLSLVH